MPGAARITILFGGALISLAWAAGRLGMLAGQRAVTDIVAEAVGVLVVVLAWRYRRDRLAAAALLIAAANLVVRTGHMDFPVGAGASALALAIAVDLGILSITRDRPLRRPIGMMWVALITLQTWFAVFGVHLLSDRLTAWLDRPALIPGALIGAVVASSAAFVIRRGAFEASLVWVAVACAAALAGWRGPHEASLLFAAGQAALLVGLFEDSYRLAFHDELTGLPGRRALNEAMRNLGSDFTIAMVDIDHFKRFNDRHGHDAGDQVLRMVAHELAGVGGGGRTYRYGGEEFAILYPGRVVADCRDDLQNLRRSIAKRKFALRGPDRPRKKPESTKRRAKPAKRVTVTVSIGAANSTARRSTPDAVLRAADRSLYRAKRAGRNRVVAAGDRLPRK